MCRQYDVVFACPTVARVSGSPLSMGPAWGEHTAMKPYDKPNSFVRRVTKRVSELIPGTTWMNLLLGESRASNNPSSTGENDDQPPVKKLCPANNTNNRTCVSFNSSINSTNHRNSHVNVHLPEISAVTCIPSTSRQSPKFVSQSNSSLMGQDNGSSSSLKRKSDVLNSSTIKRQCPKTIAFNFASSTPTLITPNKQPKNTNRENESQSLLTFHESPSKHNSSPSFRWDTFVNYGELSERQKLFAHKSPLNCSQVMYGGSSAHSNLSKILANTPAIHKKSVIPISPTTNNEIRTTSSILLNHISTKDKVIEENKFIIQPKVHVRHKANQKTIPLKIETTVKIDNTISPEKANDVSSKCCDRDTSRKLRVNISKKARGLKSEELEMPAKLDLPNVSLPVLVLPSIKLSNDNDENNEFSFNQPLTIEQFGLQIAEKSCKKQQKITLKKTPNSNTKSIKKGHHLKSTVLSTSINNSTPEASKETNEKVSIIKNDISVENVNENDKLSQFDDNSKHSFNKSVPSLEFKLDSPKSNTAVFDDTQAQDSNEKLEKLSTKIQKSWTCDGCWVPNDSNKTNCVACQTPRPSDSQQPLKIVKSITWTCETCWVPNKNESDLCIACQTQKPGTVNKVEQINTWKCDACWVMNKNDCTLCISCGTAKPGLVLESKSQPSLGFKFGLNNNFFDKSVGSQFKFGFDSGKTDQSSSQYQFGSTINNPENSKYDSSAKEFKFGMINNKADEPLATFKFAIDKPSASQPVKNASDVSSSNNTDVPSNQFKFGSFDTKMDQPESQFKFGLNVTNSAPVTQFKFGSDKVETENSVQQNFATDANKVPQSKNELLFGNNKNELCEKSIDLQNKSKELTFGDTKQTEKSTSQVTFGSIETNCNSNSFINFGHKNDDLSKVNFAWDKKDKIEIKSINFGKSQTVQPATENTNTTQLVNGHSHSNETLNEEPKPGLIKTSQLFSFGSLAKQDQHFPDDQKKPIFKFGSTTNDNKSFVTPLLSTSSFPSTIPVFGTTNTMFGSGHTTSTQGTLGSSVPAPQFSFGSMAPPTSNSFFSKTITKDEKSFLQTSNSFASGTNVGFSFGAPSAPVFNVANAGGFVKPSVEAGDQFKNKPNNIFNQSSTKQPVKLDPDAPISINFTGGTTTQFTANPETTEPPTKRKILKPVRRIR